MVNTSSLFDLRNKVALVTGASSGLGRRAAIVLSAAGAKVIGVARRRDALEELRKEIGNKRKKKNNNRRSNRRHQQTILFRINGNKTHGSYGMRSPFEAIKKRILRTGRNS